MSYNPFMYYEVWKSWPSFPEFGQPACQIRFGDVGSAEAHKAYLEKKMPGRVFTIKEILTHGGEEEAQADSLP